MAPDDDNLERAAALSCDQERASLWAAHALSGKSPATRAALMAAYLPLVQRLAAMTRRRLRGKPDLGDLVGDGCVGLASAINAFDPSRGFTFETYGSRRIIGAMLDGVRDRDWAPRHYRREMGENLPRVGRISDLCGPDLDELMRRSATTDPARRAAAADGFDRIVRGLRRRDRLMLRLIFEANVGYAVTARTLGVTASSISQRMPKLLALLRSWLGEDFHAA